MGLTEQPIKRGRGRPRKVQPTGSGYPGPSCTDLQPLTREQLEATIAKLGHEPRPALMRFYHDDGSPEMSDAEHEALMKECREYELLHLYIRQWVESLTPAARWSILEAEEPKLYHWAKADDAYTVSAKRHTSDKEQINRVVRIIYIQIKEVHSNAVQSPRATTPHPHQVRRRVTGHCISISTRTGDTINAVSQPGVLSDVSRLRTTV